VDVEQLRERILERLRSGQLPRERPLRLWGGLGEGLPCHGCRERIARDDQEIELQFTESRFRSVTFHTLCYALWELHRREG